MAAVLGGDLPTVFGSITLFFLSGEIEQNKVAAKYSFVETQRKFSIAKFSSCELGYSSALIMRNQSFAKMNLRCVSTTLYFDIFIITMQTYKK